MNTKLQYSNSKRLLAQLIRSENPTELLSQQFTNASSNEKKWLNIALSELCEKGYIQVKWADNKPYSVDLTHTAFAYAEATQEANSINENTKESEAPIVFISHRSTDAEIADMITDFLVGAGIPKRLVFCSSLPGNDIKQRISDEVKTALNKSRVNIAILSSGYYDSAYCLNEAGILWYNEEIPLIPVGLPEITPDNMYGFLGNEYKLRRLDVDTDISYIYDTIQAATKSPASDMTTLTRELGKLQAKYNSYISTRTVQPTIPAETEPDSFAIMTSDEKVLLYYIIKHKVRKVAKKMFTNWLNTAEVYGINVDNAFDLLCASKVGTLSNDILEIEIDCFRKYTSNADTYLTALTPCVASHTKLASNSFKALLTSDAFDTTLGLFVSYIIDESATSLGARWMAEGEVESIKLWEHKNSLFNALSNNYERCLSLFIQYNLVYPSDWTSHGNVRTYTLCPSLQNLLFNSCDDDLQKTLNSCKLEHYIDLPF